MDLQKVAAQANSASGQRSEAVKEGAGPLATPFADMIRLPMLMAGSLFGAKDDKGPSLDKLGETESRADHSERERSENGDDRQVNARDEIRDDDMRAEKHSDERPEDKAPRADNQRDDSDNDHEAADSGDDDDPQQASADDNNDHEDAEEAPDAEDNTTEAKPEQEAADSGTGEQVDDDVFDASAIIEAAGVSTELEPALEGLIGAAQVAQSDGAPKEAAQILSEAAASQKSVKAADAGPSTNAGNPNADGDQSRQSQQVLSNLERVGAQALNNANAAHKAAADQPLVQQQAKALADTLKSDKPVNVQVSVDNRAGTTVSQTSQALSSNSLAAQESGEKLTARTDGPRLNSADPSQQAAQARAGTTSPTAGQVQALSQLTQSNANASADSVLSRAALQVSTTGPQATHSGGGEGVNSTAPGGNVSTQQTANAQKAAQPQAARSSEQARPLAQQISVNISKALSQGLDRISIQLRPDNLGRVEVKLEVAQNGRVNATVIVDRPEALELLRNDSRNLERALQDAGLDTQSGDLSFNLRDQQEKPEESQSESNIANGVDGTEDGDLETELATRLLNGDIGDIISDMRVDIRA